MAIIILTLIAINSAVISFLPSIGKVFDKRRRGLDRIQPIGRVLIILNLFTVALSVAQYFINEAEVVTKEKAAKRDKQYGDSILKASYDTSLAAMKRKFDTSTIKVIRTVSTTLGKYGYKLDSTSNNLVKIVREPVKEIENPELSLCGGIKYEGQKNGLDRYSITYCSNSGTSTNFNLHCYAIIADTLMNNLFYLGPADTPSKEMKILNGKSVDALLYVTDKRDYNEMFLYITGTYTNIYSSKLFQVNEVYYYEKKTREFGIVVRKDKMKIVDYINKITKTKKP